jgi:acyl-CoA thioester hydrolase
MLYEIGRSEAIRSLGISYKQLEEELKIMMPVISMECRYHRPIKYDELIEIKTILEDLPSKLIHFKHEIYNQEKQVCHTAEVKLFFIDMETNKRISSPTYLNEKLSFYFDK